MGALVDRNGGHLMTSDFPPLARAAELLGGEVRGGEILCPGPGHTDSDRSLSVKPSKDNPEGFITHSFAGDSCPECREHVRKKCGLPKPKNSKATQKNGGGGVWQVLAEYIYLDERKTPYLLVKKCIDGQRQEAVPAVSLGGREVGEGKAEGAEAALQVS